MDKRIAATLTILLFTLSTVAIAVPPADASFTLGRMTNSSRWRVQDFDPHVPGVIGYVFPGGGAAAYGGSPAGSVPSIGYQSPYPGHKPSQAPTTPSQSFYQLEDNAYAPFGAILTSTADHANVGDLIFAMNFTPPPTFTGDVRFRRWYIYVPPEFGTIVRSQVTSTITNDYDSILVGKAGFNNPFGPGWTIIQVRGEDDWGACGGWTGNGQFGCVNNPNQVPGFGSGSGGDARGMGRGDRRGYIAFTAAHQYSEWYYIRVNGVTAPTIAGRYFFKYVMRPGGYNSQPTDTANDNHANVIGSEYGPSFTTKPTAANNWGVTSLSSSAGYLTYPADFNSCSGEAGINTAGVVPGVGGPVIGMVSNLLACVPVQNWPVLLVKGEIDPAIIDGIVRYAGTNTTLYGQPLGLPGRVRAVGTASDPYTGQSTGRSVEARGYFNATAGGHYEIEGVAPGVYTIYAEAAGFPEQVIAQNVKILAGQSLHFDALLNPGVVIHGQVFSKHNFGEEAWTRTAPIWIEIWDTNNYADPTHIVSQSPWNRLEEIPTPGSSPTATCAIGVPNCYTATTTSGYITELGPYGIGRYDAIGLTNAARMPYDYVNGADASLNGGGPMPQRVAFDWESPSKLSYYVSQTPTTPGPSVTCATDGSGGGWLSGTVGFDNCRRHDGVGPAQYWWVDPFGQFTNGGGTGSFVYQFGYKIGGAAIYGAPKDLDGHVPQALIAYINGMTPGRYYVRAFVNGYVQTALDGRTWQDYFFDVAKDEWSGDVTVPLDLLKTSYITKTIHFHDIPGSLIENQVLSSRTVVAEVWDVSSDLSKPVLAGVNTTIVTAGATSLTFNITGLGLNGFTPEPAFGNGQTRLICQVLNSTVIVGGFQQWFDAFDGQRALQPGGHCLPPSTIYTAPYTGTTATNVISTLGQLVGPHRISPFGAWGSPYEDSGFRAGTYEIRCYVQGYVQQTFERVTIALSNSPAIVSDHMWKGASFNITVFSTDWERPRVERPWVYPGEPVFTYFTNSKGVIVDYDAQGAQDFVPVMVLNPGTGGNTPTSLPSNCLTLANLIIAGASYCFDTTQTTSVGTQPYFDGNDVYAEPIMNTGAWGDTGGGDATWHESVLTDVIFNAAPGAPVHPTGFDTDTYTVNSYTYGYVQKKPFSLFAQKGNSTSDVKVNLVVGANVTLNLKFKLENVFEQTQANMSMRVRLFNEKGQLAAAWTTSTYDGVGAGVRSVGPNFVANNPASCTDITNPPAQFGILNCYASAYSRQSGPPSPVIAYDVRNLVLNYVPAGTTDLQINLNGIPEPYRDPDLAKLTAAYLGADGKPAPLLGGGGGWGPGIATIGPDYPYGIDAYPNYQGTWTVEVDTMNWYNTFTTGYSVFGGVNSYDVAPTASSATSYASCVGTFTSLALAQCLGYYPPVVGLLQGESFHTIPGHPNGLYGYTTDALSANHLGPFAQRMVFTVPNAHLGGESSVAFELDQRAYISGDLNAFTWSGELRPLSFASITIGGAGGFKNTEYSWDGIYQAFLNPGDYNFTVVAWSPAGQGYKVLNVPVHLSDGQTAVGQDFGPLERSNIPIPEFSGIAVVAFSALAASLYLLRRRRK